MSHAPKISEPIPGYVLKVRIGVGGYGEVWRAQAPGDLSKAVKLVYGYFDDERASRELKALKRIKEVRHPFLLSLERIEIIDGQLIIVTELADMSLKDRFEQARSTGSGHIPRDELLGYLRDAADALDYMSDNFSLQHLDIKPENLLLVGNHVKVGDFGLVKELQDVTASLMGGLTPVYASPEVFDGRPSQRSDQYSLAIVYQEMLTGELPFPGKTAAQLAAQHVHARPRLVSLPQRDQPIIARALHKDAAQRFPSCRALIDCLSSADSAAGRRSSTDAHARERADSTSDTTPIRSRAAETDHDWRRSGAHQPDAGKSSPNERTVVLGEETEREPVDEPAASTTLGECSAGTLLPPSAPLELAVDLPPVVHNTTTTAWLRPTLFLGIGGTATRTLRQLRRQLHDRLGPAGSLPAVGMLLLDTDTQSLYQATQDDGGTALADSEVLALPLRSARDYASDSPKSLQWLSRRWLYNIPRSLQTEGRRPLGRLALVDHFDPFRKRLRESLSAITSHEAITATAQATGLTFASNVPRVLVISSISGGTGGGMVLDVVYAVRALLAEIGQPDDGVCTILTHSTDRSSAASDLAIANAYACLSEMYHYHSQGCDLGSGAREHGSFPASEAAFRNTYLAHLGDNLNDHQLDEATDALASYLYLNCVTPAAAVFDECRKQTEDALERVSLRSFGLARVGGSHTSLPALVAERLCKEVVDRWLGAAPQAMAPSSTASLVEIATQRGKRSELSEQALVDQSAADHARQIGLDVNRLGQEVRLLVEQQLGGSPETAFSKLLAGLDQSPDTPPRQYVQRTLSALWTIFGPSAALDPQTQLSSTPIEAALEEGIKQLAMPRAVAVRDWILSLIDNPAARVAGAARAKQWYDDYWRAMDSQIVERLHKGQHELREMEQALHAAAAAAPPRRRTLFGGGAKKVFSGVDSGLAHVVRLRYEQTTLRLTTRVLRVLAAQVAAAGDQLKELHRELGQLGQHFASASPWEAPHSATPESSVVDEVASAVADRLRHRMPAMLQAVDAEFQVSFLELEGGLRGVFRRIEVRSRLVEALRAKARAQVLRALQETSIDQPVLGSTSAGDGSRRLQACLDAALPRLDRCGGARRLIAVAPKASAESSLAQALTSELDPPATIVFDTDPDLVLCYEAQELWVPYVAARLVGDRGDLVRIASRLHTRADVDWTELARASDPEAVPCLAD